MDLKKAILFKKIRNHSQPTATNHENLSQIYITGRLSESCTGS